MEPFRPSLAICGICRRPRPDPKSLPRCRHHARSRPRQPPRRSWPKKANVRERVDIRQLDVTAFESILATTETIVKDHGRIDVLVNNAGSSMSGFAEGMSLDELRRQFDTNFFGVVAMSKAVISVMRQQKSGHIIQVASVSGRVGNHSSAPILQLEVRPRRLERVFAHGTALTGHPSCVSRTRLVRYRHLDAQRHHCQRRARSQLTQQGTQPAFCAVRERPLHDTLTDELSPNSLCASPTIPIRVFAT